MVKKTVNGNGLSALIRTMTTTAQHCYKWDYIKLPSIQVPSVPSDSRLRRDNSGERGLLFTRATNYIGSLGPG